MAFELNHIPEIRFLSDEVKGARSMEEVFAMERKGQVIAKNKAVIKPTSQAGTLAPDFYDGVKALVDTGVPENLKIWYDFSRSLEQVPLVYKQLYQTLSDRNLPEVIPVKDFAPITDFFFTQVLDGEAVLLNDVEGKGAGIVTLQINAGGWLTSFRESLFGNGVREANMRDSAARGYRHYLNAVYMNPIVSFAGVPNKTLFNASSIKDTPKASMTWFEKNWYILKAMIQASAKYKKENQISCTYVPVMNEVTFSYFVDVADAVNPDGNKRYPSLMNFFRNAVVYNGAHLKDKEGTVIYTGIEDGAILYVPIGCKHFVEFEKLPLTAIADEGLANNLGAKTNVLYDCRGMYATTDGMFKAQVVPLTDTNNADSPMKNS